MLFYKNDFVHSAPREAPRREPPNAPKKPPIKPPSKGRKAPINRRSHLIFPNPTESDHPSAIHHLSAGFAHPRAEPGPHHFSFDQVVKYLVADAIFLLGIAVAKFLAQRFFYFSGSPYAKLKRTFMDIFSDMKIADQIHTALQQDPLISRSDIRVTVSGG